MGQGSESISGEEDWYDEDDYREQLYNQRRTSQKTALPKVVLIKKYQQRGLKVDKNCSCCGVLHTVRQADLNRGWGKFCSKSCKAKNQSSKFKHNGLRNKTYGIFTYDLS